MKYCTRCLYPDTKPDLTFNEEGVCSACLSFEARKNINWTDRKRQFVELIAKYRELQIKEPYDCIIPVSGGKDSHYQVLKALEYGLRPLAITAITDDLSDLGRRNLDNIAKLGVDHIFVSTNAEVRRRINKYTLETIGDISWAEHVTIFTIPIREAILRQIPLIIWGENPQNEYGGPNEESQKAIELDHNWLNEFGGLNGLRAQDIIDAGIAIKEQMYQYISPYNPHAKVNPVPPKAIFLGQFFPWDGRENAHIANQNGFEIYDYPVEGCGVHYENLDNHQTGIHDRFKYLKFGFGRATDIACNWIRRGYMSREEGKEHILKYDGKYPDRYLGKHIINILKNIGIYTTFEYGDIEEKFVNRDLFLVADEGLTFLDGSRILPKFTQMLKDA